MIGAWARSMVPFACLILLITLGLTACGTSGITDPGMYGTATTTLQPGSYGSLSETPGMLHKVTIVQFIDNARTTDGDRIRQTNKILDREGLRGKQGD